MNTFTATKKDVNQAEKIRRRYLDKENDKMEQLRKLDEKVKAPGKIAASVIGVVGALVMGSGMAFVMVWEDMALGLVLGIPGMIAAAVAYPIYSLITNARKQKYADEIMKISSEVIGNNDEQGGNYYG